MAEQLLILGCIDETQLQSMDMVRAQADIGITLLSYSSIYIANWLYTYMASDLLARYFIIRYTHYFIYIVDMRERCTLCGAGDDSLSHPDYVDWVSGCDSV